MNERATLQESSGSGRKRKPHLSQGLYNTIEPEPQPSQEVKQYRKETLYDAVAGRIAVSGFIPKVPIISSTRDTTSSSTIAAAPESLLFRRKNAPPRYVESDFYFTSDRAWQAPLPESDLLTELHSYVSDFYSRTTTDAGAADWRSFDETALLAFGVLLEEAARESLGQTGDLVFTEGEDVSLAYPQASVPNDELEASKISRKRPPKRRRVDATPE